MITAILMGIVGGLLIKALFVRESNVVWDAAFGAIGGLAAYYLYGSLTPDVTQAVFALGTAVVVAGVLHAIWTRFAKPA